jgi:DNA 3'-phosphatase
MDKPVELHSSGAISHENVLMCDLDGTLITTKSGNKFPKFAQDWKFIDGVFDKLQSLKSTWSLVIITNQGGRNKKMISGKIASVYAELRKHGFNVQIYAAHKYDHYRKPETGIFDEYIFPQITEATQLIWVGDAMGREGDFSDSDLKFGENLKKKYPKLKIKVKNEKYLLKK